MAQVRYHLGPNGPGICRVNPDNPRSTGCRFGRDSEHYATVEAAEEAYAQKMEAEGNGTVANSAQAPGADSTESDLQGSLNRVFRTHFDDMASDSYYGLSRASDGGFLADSTEGLERFRSDFIAKTGEELDPVANLGPKPYSGVIQKLSIPELNIEIRNQNYDQDVREVQELQELKSSGWRANRS